MGCKAITQNDKQCSRSALNSGYCSQHDKDYKITMFKKELAKMHSRLRLYSKKIADYHERILIIDKLDYIKYELNRRFGKNQTYRYLVRNADYKKELEDIFNTKFEDIAEEYDKLLNLRNRIVHKYTIDLWR